MSATQRSRTPYLNADRAFEDKTLIESGNEIAICQKIDFFLGGYPDPTGSGAFKAVAVSFNSTNNSFTMDSTDDADKFKAGDEVVIYNEDDNSRLSVIKNCVKEVDGTTVYMFKAMTDLPDEVTIEKNLVFRGSNVNTYRQDEYGIKRFYPAIAGVAEIESSMGEMFEYKWDRSDFSFTMDNYDKRFDPYMPGGELYSTFALKDVNVYFGFGEEAAKNRLVFSGVTNLNNGVSEEDEKLKFTAYDISYLYNIPVNFNTFPDDILDQDFAGKPIPMLFGDYTTVGAFVGGINRPVVPAVLTRIITTLQNSQLLINATDFGVSSSVRIKAKTFGTTWDGYQIEIIYSRQEQGPTFMPSVSVTALGGGKNKFTVTFYRGKSTGGTLYASTLWLKFCLNTSSAFSSNFSFTGEKNELITEYKNYTVPYNNSGSTDNSMLTKLYTTNGGASTKQCIYKICANGLAYGPSFSFVANKGSWDEPADWEVAGNIGGSAATNVVWNRDTGELLLQPNVGLTDDQIKSVKVFVWVAGARLENTSIKKDDLLRLNVANASPNSADYAYNDKSGNGAIGVFFGPPKPEPGGGFLLGGYVRIEPYSLLRVPATPRVCEDKFLWWGGDCSGGDPAYDIASISSMWYNFNLVQNLAQQDFVFEIECQKEVDPRPFANARLRVPGTIPYLFGFGLRSNAFHTPKITGSFSGPNSEFWLDFNGTVIKTGQATDPTKVYGIKIRKIGTIVRIYRKNITDGGIYTECTYTTGNTVPNVAGDNVNYVTLGTGRLEYSPSAGNFYGKIGMTRFRVGANNFMDEDFTIYGTQNANSDIVSIARQVIKMGGADSSMFDTTWDNFYQDKTNQSYDARAYVMKDDLKTIDYAVELLGQIGIVLTMKEDSGKMKFSLVWDSLDNYRKGNKEITAYDIEFGTVSIERELNQYFNTAKADYNYNPAMDELGSHTGSYFEPEAVYRDGNLNVWFGREDKGFKAFEFPALFTPSDVADVIKHIIANSTPNSEMITCNLSWRHLMLQVGEYVTLNFGRYQNVPAQVRSIKLNANGSSIEVKFRSLENVQFVDETTGLEYTPANFDGVGGVQALANITNRTDEGDT